MRYVTCLLLVVIYCAGCDKKANSSPELNTSAAKTSTSQSKTLKTAKKKPKKTDEGSKDVEVPTREDAETLLVGIWRLDIKSIKADEAIRQLPKAEQFAALKLRRDSMRQVAYEFAADGKLNIFLGGESKQSGTYEIKKVEKAEGDEKANANPDGKNSSIIFVETNTVGPIGSKNDRWQVNVHTKSLHVKDIKTGDSFRLFRGGPVFKAVK